MPAWANAERGEGAHMTAQKEEKSDRPLTNKPWFQVFSEMEMGGQVFSTEQ